MRSGAALAQTLFSLLPLVPLALPPLPHPALGLLPLVLPALPLLLHPTQELKLLSMVNAAAADGPGLRLMVKGGVFSQTCGIANASYKRMRNIVD